jgi:Excalibur calcium-binding domain
VSPAGLEPTLTASLLIAAAIAAAAIGAAPVATASGPYANCTEAHQDGRYNIPKGDTDYWIGGDRDRDGIACES